jgi:hypothetical protein
MLERRKIPNKILVAITEWKGPLERPKCRWYGIITKILMRTWTGDRN